MIESGPDITTKSAPDTISISVARLTLLERIATAAERLLCNAAALQEQFNPESFEVSADVINELTVALHQLTEAEAADQDGA
jgi:hypothetical protein